MAIQEYKYNSTVQVSPHFNIKEFRCKCGGTHSNKFDPNLSILLERLYTALDCSKIVVNSGYRCTKHDKAVGGSGYGQHTIGNAADIVCFDKKGNKINTGIISCVALEIGFGGIANINKSYTAIHLDVRSTKYHGDEVYGFSSIWNQKGKNGKKWDSLYSYYGLTKKDISVYLSRIGLYATTKASSTGETGNTPNATKWTNKKDTTIVELQVTLKQLGNSISADGIAGPNTLKTFSKYPLAKGTTSDVVKWVQGRLNAMGYSAGNTDGVSGTKTINAINALKKDYGITLAGIPNAVYYYLLVK